MFNDLMVTFMYHTFQFVTAGLPILWEIYSHIYSNSLLAL